jgi:hypothetical protein
MAFVLAAACQQPDTAKKAIVNPKDTLVSTKQDTDVTRQFKPKHRKMRVYVPDSLHSPHTAVIRSLLIPGWGQVYNHRWWKVPVIYGTLGLLADAIIFNNTYYKEFLALSVYREHGVAPAPNQPYYNDYLLYGAYSNEALYDTEDGYRRNRDLSILGFVGFWGINVVDAYIDAKFMHSYTLSNNLSMHIEPSVMNQEFLAQSINGAYIPGIKITFTF